MQITDVRIRKVEKEGKMKAVEQLKEIYAIGEKEIGAKKAIIKII